MKSAHQVCIALLAATGLLFIQPAAAHHSGAGFDGTRVIEIKGTIKEFQFKNPHTWLQVLVEDSSGKMTEWSLEWGSPNQLGRMGYRPTTFPPGAKVTIRMNPMRNGAPAGGFIAAKFDNGTTVGQWNDKVGPSAATP